MTTTEGIIAGRSPRASRFATAQTALKKQKKDARRSRRRAAAAWRPDPKSMTPASIIAAGARPLRMLQEILDHADVIALDEPARGRSRKVHILVTLPEYLLDQATALAAIDEDDEDTDGTESDQDKEPGEDEEASLGACDGLVNQSKWGHEGALPWDHIYGDNRDLEFDEGYAEPSLGSLDGEVNQERWAACDRLDRERGPGDGDSDDDEDSHDRESDTSDFEPEHEEPSLSPCGFSTVGSSQNYGGAIDGEEDGYGKSDPRDAAIRAALKVHASVPVPQPALAAAEPEPGAPELWFPTGNRPGGRLEMENQATGATGVWMLLTRDGEAL